MAVRLGRSSGPVKSRRTTTSISSLLRNGRRLFPTTVAPIGSAAATISSGRRKAAAARLTYRRANGRAAGHLSMRENGLQGDGAVVAEVVSHTITASETTCAV